MHILLLVIYFNVIIFSVYGRIWYKPNACILFIVIYFCAKPWNVFRNHV